MIYYTLMKRTRETLINCLCGRIAKVQCRAVRYSKQVQFVPVCCIYRNLNIFLYMSRFLRSVRLALHPTQTINQCFPSNMNHIIVVLLVILGLQAGCSTTEIPPGNSHTSVAVKKGEYRKISAKEARIMMSEVADYILLDVRTGAEFKEKRIDGAILIPDYEIKNRAENELPDRNMLILIYCRSGRRSENAAREMIRMGYTNIYDIGGISDWGYDTLSD